MESRARDNSRALSCWQRLTILVLAAFAFGSLGSPVSDSRGDIPNAELEELYAGDQQDRKTNMHDIDWTEVSRRDAERRKRVMEIVEAGDARVAEDYYHAAMVFQHGEGVEDIRWARDWAKKATELASDPESKIYERAKWLLAAATDRHLHRQGKPQIFGTQFKRDPPGPWTMEPFDRQAITEEERAANGVRSIAEQESRLEAMNEELRERGLLEPVDAEGEDKPPVGKPSGG